ncbi:MAG: NADH-quinone oxidoreductase subunit C, partial [Fidelibacterota bacterium]
GILDILSFLKENEILPFDFLVDISGVDCLEIKAFERFAVVYHLYSFKHGLRIRVKAFVAEKNPEIDSVTSLWPAANWQEREVYDLFGIKFRGHPDLRRLLLPDDFKAHPLRKDYPLKGMGERSKFRVIKRELDST